MFALSKVQGPECPSCGCQQSLGLGIVKSWGKPLTRRRCRHCGRKWLSKADTIPEPPPTAPQPPSGNGKAVIFHVNIICCPQCQSSNTRVTSAPRPTRYHKCNDCQFAFKSVERIG